MPLAERSTTTVGDVTSTTPTTTLTGDVGQAAASRNNNSSSDDEVSDIEIGTHALMTSLWSESRCLMSDSDTSIAAV